MLHNSINVPTLSSYPSQLDLSPTIFNKIWIVRAKQFFKMINGSGKVINCDHGDVLISYG